MTAKRTCRAWLSVLCLAPALAAAQDRPPVGSLDALGAAIRQCWSPPAGGDHRDATVRFSLRADGSVFGDPTIIYAHDMLKNDEKAAYTASLRHAILLCAPFALSQRYGAAIAGHPIRIRFTVPRRDGH